MPQPKQTAEEVRKAYVDLAFDEAYAIRETLYGSPENGTVGVYGRRKANREELRNLAAQGFLSDALREELDEIYPERDAARRTDEERAAELEARAAEVRKRAAAKKAPESDEAAAA